MTTVSKRFDAKRTVYGTKTVRADARCSVPIANVDYSDLNITLGSHTLSDTYTMQIPLNSLGIDSEVTGTLKDFNYRFKVEETSESNGRFSYTGRYSSDKLLYTNYRIVYDYTVDPEDPDDKPPQSINVRSGFIANLLAKCLGLELYYQAWNWMYPLSKIGQSKDNRHHYYGISGTYAAILSQVFGWLSDLPHVDFNVFIREENIPDGPDGFLYIVQRGSEDGDTYELSEQHLGWPCSISRKRVRTEWQGNADEPQDEYKEEPENQEPFSGTIAFGPCKITYEDGYLVREENTETGSTTTYTYVDIPDANGNNQKYLQKKETINSSEMNCSKTEYTYNNLGDELYLSCERVYTNGSYGQGGADYTDADVTTTTHTPIGNGWYGHTTYNADGETTDTSLSQGAPGNTVSQYMVNRTQEAFKSLEAEIAEAIISGILRYLHPPMIPTNYPVKDRDTVVKLIDATDWLNGRIEEHVSLEVLNSNHIFDFNDVLTFCGNRYYLVSNNVRHSAENGLRQGLEIVRWY